MYIEWQFSVFLAHSMFNKYEHFFPGNSDIWPQADILLLNIVWVTQEAEYGARLHAGLLWRVLGTTTVEGRAGKQEWAEREVKLQCGSTEVSTNSMGGPRARIVL